MQSQSPVPCVPCPCRARKIYQPVFNFFRDILDTENHAATDVYAYMFMADVVDFIIIIFGFWAFGVSRESYRVLTALPPPRGEAGPHPDLSCTPEIHGGHRHHLLAVGKPSARGFPGHGALPVQHHDHRPCALPPQDRAGQAHLPSYPGLWHPLLDVLHPAGRHPKVHPKGFPATAPWWPRLVTEE